MKQKLAIACGLLHEPPALLFDEPLTGLDPIGIRRMKRTIVARARARRGGRRVVAPAAPGRGDLHRILIIDKGGRSPTARSTSSRRAPDLAAGRDLEEIFLHATGHADAEPS